MQDHPTIEKWHRWIDLISADVSQLYFCRHVHDGVVAIAEQNEHVDLRSPFFGVFRRTYADTVIMGIRRQMKAGSRSISLVGLLADMANGYSYLTRTWFFTHEPHLKGHTVEAWRNKTFDGFAGQGGTYVDPARIMSDVAALKAKSQSVEKIADKRIAHWDPTSTAIDVTFSEISETLDFLGVVLKKYHLLLNAADWHPEPVSDYPVFDVFRYAWDLRSADSIKVENEV